MRIRFRHATVLTVNPNNEILFDTDVLIDDDRIREICPSGQTQKNGVEADRTIDASGQVLMPGLINGHTHLSMSLFRNYGNDVSLSTWLNDYIWPLEDVMAPEDFVIGARLNILEMLRSGTTTFVDMYGQEDRIAELVSEMGIRAVLCSGVLDGNREAKFEEIRRLVSWNHAANDRIRVMIAPHAVYTCSPETLGKIHDLGEKLGLGYHLHLSETQQEEAECREKYGLSPTQMFDRFGLLREDSILAHAIWMDEADQDLIATRHASIVYNPASNMKLASGFLPLRSLQKKGINVALGTDGASSNNTQDLFRDMMLGSLIQKGHDLDPTVADARTMLRMATIQGAKAIGREADLGSVEVGKRADLLLADFQNIRHTPQPDDIEAALVYATSSEDVSLTMVDGEILMENGSFTKASASEAMAAANASWQGIKQRGGRA